MTRLGLLAGCLCSLVLATPVFASQDPGDRVVGAAVAKLGVPYRFGATGPDAFDCSGLVQWSFRAAGIPLPRTTREQRRAGRPIPLTQARRGDLLFYRYERGPRSDPKAGALHVAIYMGDGRAVHAPSSGGRVEAFDIDTSHWSNRFVGAVTPFEPSNLP